MAIQNGFIDAKTARDIAIGGAAKSTVVFDEIHVIETQILNDANLGKLEIQTGSTPGIVTNLTSNSDVFNAWMDSNLYQDDVHRVARARMNEIINYFTLLGYTIKRERDGVQDRFRWIVRW